MSTWFKPPPGVVGPYGRALEKYSRARDVYGLTQISFNTDGSQSIMLSCVDSSNSDTFYFLVLVFDKARRLWSLKSCGLVKDGSTPTAAHIDSEMYAEIVLAVNSFAAYLVRCIETAAEETNDFISAEDAVAARANILSSVAKLGERFTPHFLASMFGTVGKTISTQIVKTQAPFPTDPLRLDLTALLSINRAAHAVDPHTTTLETVDTGVVVFIPALVAVAAEMAGANSDKEASNA